MKQPSSPPRPLWWFSLHLDADSFSFFCAVPAVHDDVLASIRLLARWTAGGLSARCLWRSQSRHARLPSGVAGNGRHLPRLCDQRHLPSLQGRQAAQCFLACSHLIHLNAVTFSNSQAPSPRRGMRAPMDVNRSGTDPKDIIADRIRRLVLSQNFTRWS